MSVSGGNRSLLAFECVGAGGGDERVAVVVGD